MFIYMYILTIVNYKRYILFRKKTTYFEIIFKLNLKIPRVFTLLSKFGNFDRIQKNMFFFCKIATSLTIIHLKLYYNNN